MPTYTFRCPVHGDFQVEQTMSETTQTSTCPRGAHEPWNAGTECPKVLSANIDRNSLKQRPKKTK